MKRMRCLLGTAVVVAGLTVVGLAHDPYDAGYGRYARREHRYYHAQKEYEHVQYHRYPHSRLGHALYHLDKKLEHRDFHLYQSDRDYAGYYGHPASRRSHRPEHRY
ncbi:MAG: hypothetical protein HYR55_11690 [Acidobacteria bacterium]|nr:hypothetical protein [Acidobacteriota bacterium]MBI3657251.1 hypothetical protein [Acidobacteriota bacterium]